MPATYSITVDPYAETLISQAPPTPSIDTAVQQIQRDLELELAKNRREMRFLRAWDTDNKEEIDQDEIIASYEDILHHGDHDTLAHISSTRQNYILSIRQHRAALAKFERAIQPPIYLKELLTAYHEAKQVEP